MAPRPKAFFRRPSPHASRESDAGWAIAPLEERLLLAADLQAADVQAAEVAAPTYPTTSEEQGPGSTQHEATASAADAASQDGTAINGVVFVDRSAMSAEQLVSEIAPGNDLVMLDPKVDGLTQITGYLAAHRNLKSIHIVSHGTAGHLKLGASDLTAESLPHYRSKISTWRHAFAPGADLLLYGCDFAATNDGRKMVEELRSLTGLDIAASIDRTGNEVAGGNWELEHRSGEVEASIFLTEAARRSFQGHLAIEIRAAGSMGSEVMQLEVDDKLIASWRLTDTDAENNVFGTYFAEVGNASVNQIRLRFTNDLYDPGAGIDRNLRVDSIRLNGVTHQAEASSVYASGVYIGGQGIRSGFLQSEYLHTDGYLEFGSSRSSTGSLIQVFASGDTGDEQAQLQIDGVVVKSFGPVPKEGMTLAFQADRFVRPEQIRVAFVNDVFQPGYDRNLRVDQIEVDGVVYRTTDPTVYSTAGYIEGRGIVEGFLQQDRLFSNGYFQFGGSPTGPSDDSLRDGLVGYWKLDETAIGQTARDASGNSNDGVVSNFNAPFGPTTDIAVQREGNLRALSFDGANDAVNIGFSESLRLTSGTYSQSLWMKPTSAADIFRGIIGFQPGSLAGGRYPFIYQRGTSLYAGFGTGGDTWKGVVATNVLTIGQWSHVAVSFDGSEMNLYVNGRLVGFNSNFGGSQPTTQVAQLSLGRINNQYQGLLDEVRMYRRALTEGEVSRLAAGYLDSAGDAPSNPSASPGSVGFAATQTTVNENSGSVSITFRRTNGSAGFARVFYQTQDGTAIEGRDYVGQSSGFADFADGQLTATVSIPVINNSNTDGDRTFQLSMFRVEGASQGEPRTSIVTIVDDESAGGLIGHWRLDDANANGVITDASGKGLNGRGFNFGPLSGSTSDAPNTASGNSGSIRFDGQNDFVEIGPSEALRLTTGKYSQSVWIKPTHNDSAFHAVLGFQEGTSVGTRYPFIYVRNDSIYAGFGAGGNTWKGVVANNVITRNAWNHVAVSFDGNTMVLFVNGEEAGRNSNFGGSLPTTQIARLNIGRIDNFFVGSIDDVRMYDRAITGSEVRSLIDRASLPPPKFSGFFVRDVIARGFAEPTTIERLPDGRMLVAERAGVIRLVNANGTVSSQPFLDIRDMVNRVGNDRGLMSIAIPPDFANTRQIYVAFTYDPPEVRTRGGDGGPDGEGGRVARIVRYTVNESWTFADRSTEQVVLGKNSTYDNIGQPNRRPELNDPRSGVDAIGNYIEDFIASDELSHTIGDMEFGPDGALYVSVGDGGSYGRVDPVNLRALDLNSLNGKILRIDRNTGQGLPDNPFYDGNPNSNRSRVYSLGLRNPFRIAINPNNGEVYIADVGWLNWEEINTGRGKNFGWPVFEGNGPTGGSRGSYGSLPEVRAYLATNPDLTGPLWTRSHASGATAIIMGDFIAGGDYPSSLQGAFLFTDIGDQVLRAGRLDAQGRLIDVIPVSSAIGFITDIMRMPDGSLYYTDLVAGTIGRLVYNA